MKHKRYLPVLVVVVCSLHTGAMEAEEQQGIQSLVSAFWGLGLGAFTVGFTWGFGIFRISDWRLPFFVLTGLDYEGLR